MKIKTLFGYLWYGDAKSIYLVSLPLTEKTLDSIQKHQKIIEYQDLLGVELKNNDYFNIGIHYRGSKTQLIKDLFKKLDNNSSLNYTEELNFNDIVTLQNNNNINDFYPPQIVIRKDSIIIKFYQDYENFEIEFNLNN